MSEEILIALGDLTNGALNYYQTPRVVMAKRDIIDTYIEQLQQENQQLKKIKGKNQRTEDVLRQILKYCNYLHNDCKYRLNDGHIRKIRKIIRDYFGEEDKER